MTSSIPRKPNRGSDEPAARYRGQGSPDRDQSRLGTPARRTGGAFTLLELVLVLCLMGLMMGLAIAGFGGALSRRQLDEQPGRITSLLAALRAEAANSARRYRLSFDEATGQPAVTVEADPLGAPGVFTPYQSWWVKLGSLAEGVFVERFQLTGVSDYCDMSATVPGGAERAQGPVLTFYPDGSSESAMIILSNADPAAGAEATWSVHIGINGVDGTVTVRDISGLDEAQIEEMLLLPPEVLPGPAD